MQAALKAFETWSRTTVQERTTLLFRVAQLLRERKFELEAWLSFEVGKNYAEADGDIAELIDFCMMYALEALRLEQAATAVQLPGEHDQLRYIPLGVGAVIPPWNFPAAIMGGMTLASIVCGNTVVLKPSGDSPTIAAKFMEILEEAGLPDGVVNYCPGHGSTFGNAIVEHPKTRYIAFTGSKEVGLHINQTARAATAGPGVDQAHHPRDGRQGLDGGRCDARYRRRSRRAPPRPRSDSADRSVRRARASSWTSASTTSSCRH